MTQGNCIKIAESVKIDDRYDMTIRDAQAIRDTYGDDLAVMIFTAFKFGYAQGEKATLADMEKGATMWN